MWNIFKNKNKSRLTKRGFTLTYIMIMVGAVTVSAALWASKSSTFTANRSKIYKSSSELRMLSMSCAEKLLMQVRTSPTTNGSGTLVEPQGSCAYVISGEIPNKTITFTATRDNFHNKITIITSRINPNIVSTWSEGL